MKGVSYQSHFYPIPLLSVHRLPLISYLDVSYIPLKDTKSFGIELDIHKQNYMAAVYGVGKVTQQKDRVDPFCKLCEYCVQSFSAKPRSSGFLTIWWVWYSCKITRVRGNSGLSFSALVLTNSINQVIRTLSLFFKVSLYWTIVAL